LFSLDTAEAPGRWLRGEKRSLPYVCYFAGVASLIEIASIRPGAVGVDLVNGHGDVASRLDLRDLLFFDCILGILADVDVSAKFSPPTLIGSVCLNFCIADNCGVLLAGVYVNAFAGNVGIDCME